MNIARRLQLIALLVMLTLIFLSWFSINRLGAGNRDLSYVTDNTVPSISLIKEVQADFYELHSLVQTHVLNTDSSKMQQIETGITEIRGQINSLLDKYKAEMLSNDEDRRLTDDDQRIVAQYYQEIDKVLQLSHQNKNDEAQRHAGRRSLQTVPSICQGNRASRQLQYGFGTGAQEAGSGKL